MSALIFRQPGALKRAEMFVESRLTEGVVL
jgi:hypothetical protein